MEWIIDLKIEIKQPHASTAWLMNNSCGVIRSVVIREEFLNIESMDGEVYTAAIQSTVYEGMLFKL